MANFSMTCTCGHTMTVDAANRDEAVSKFKAGMTQQALDDHMRQYHQPGDPKPTLEQSHAMIEQMVAAA
jgi:hypothetical protein